MAKEKKFLLSFDDEDPVEVGLVRLVKDLSPEQFFFKLNNDNIFKFKRSEDLKIEFFGKEYSFLQMEIPENTFHVHFRMIANKSFERLEKTPNSLFEHANEIVFLFENQQDVDYLLISENASEDFSVILLPENLVFPIQKIFIEPNEFIYQYIQNNE